MVTDIDMNMTQCLSSKHSQFSGEGRPCVRDTHLRAETGGIQPSVEMMSELSFEGDSEVVSLERRSQCRANKASKG